tara:strand:+ start:1297 stop:2307 length:1011 start_codon:yes stop_codon:yes gene_type:complete
MMTSAFIPNLIVTAGEPAGIGPDLCVYLAQQTLACKLVVTADRELLQERARLLQLPLQLINVESTAPIPHQAGSLHVLHRPLNGSVVPGKPSVENASYVLATLKAAVEGCCRGQFDAMVTAPVHKGVINDAGVVFTGHTEYLAQLTNSQVVMMLVGGNMRVTLATTHIPLKDVAEAITVERLEGKLRIIHRDLISRFRIASPCIAVTGLNPHAGESGHLGNEEIDIIIPILDKLRSDGLNLVGPVSADTVFNPSQLSNYDCIFAMFHDQGLPVLKHASFGTGVNVTLGLPIIRTSVDHGTALDLAATGRIDSGSLLAAIEMAITLAKNKRMDVKNL